MRAGRLKRGGRPGWAAAWPGGLGSALLLPALQASYTSRRTDSPLGERSAPRLIGEGVLHGHRGAAQDAGYALLVGPPWPHWSALDSGAREAPWDCRLEEGEGLMGEQGLGGGEEAGALPSGGGAGPSWQRPLPQFQAGGLPLLGPASAFPNSGGKPAQGLPTPPVSGGEAGSLGCREGPCLLCVSSPSPREFPILWARRPGPSLWAPVGTNACVPWQPQRPLYP